MSKIALAKKEIEDCFQVLHLLSLNNSDSKKVSDSFTRFPNGFFINDRINSESFLTETIKEPSTKDKISKFLSSVHLIKKLGTTSFEITIPTSFSEKNENISAFKLINDSLIVWTKNLVYKIPASEKALKRIEMTKENIAEIKKLDSEIQNFFLIPIFIDYEDNLLLCSTKCATLSLDKNTNAIDSFLSLYFSKIFSSAVIQDSIKRGFQHGDLHFRNILQDNNNKLYITDLDLININGFPFLDIMHFSIHLIRTLEQTTQYKPLKLFLEEKSYLYNKLREYNFSELSEIWLQYYHDDYIPLYIQSQIEWYHYNKVHSDELTQLKQLQERFNI